MGEYRNFQKSGVIPIDKDNFLWWAKCMDCGKIHCTVSGPFLSMNMNCDSKKCDKLWSAWPEKGPGGGFIDLHLDFEFINIKKTNSK